MAFNTSSFLAGVGSVVVVLSTGFAGGYFFASPDHHAQPNLLQRAASDAPTTKNADASKDTDAKAASITTPRATPEVAAVIAAPTEAKPAETRPAEPSATQSPAAAQPAPSASAASQQASTEPRTTPRPPTVPEQTTARATHEKTTSEKMNPGKPNAEEKAADEEHTRAEAKATSRKRAEARKLAERQRRQHERDVAASAVPRIVHGSDGEVHGHGGEEIIVHNGYLPDQDVMEVDRAESPGPDAPAFTFFGR